MFFTYILKSLKDHTRYYGSTNNLEARIKIHNSGKEKYTRGHKPYKLLYYESFDTRKDAITRERFFNSVDGYNWLKSKGINKG